MGATNHTINYNLPQFVGSDKPTWLGDFNSAMNAIDTQMKANDTLANTAKTTADTALTNSATAQTVANNAQTKADTADTTANSALNKALQNESDVSELKTSITHSTSEIVVGTWLGKPLYRKVFVIDKSDTSNSNIDITHGISNLDLFTNVYGSIKRTDNIMNVVPNVNVSSTSYLARIADLDSSLIRVRLGEDIYNSMSTLYIVAEYTKNI